MTDVYRDTDHRYLHDAAFHGAVQMLESLARQHGYTPGELKQIAFKAALNIEMSRPPLSVEELAARGIVISDLAAGEKPVPFTTPEVAGHLKDGTPVYFGTAKPENYGSSEPR